jgi:protein O-GlcNAc transferase
MSINFPPAVLEIIQYIKEGRLLENQATINRILAEDEKNLGFLLSVGISCAQANKLHDALFIFNCLSSFNRRDARIFYNLGLVQALLGDHQEAIKAYDCALSIEPDDLETLINKGSSCNDLQSYELALDALKRAVQLNPNVPEAWSNMGIALNHLHLYSDSVNAYQNAIQIHPQYFEAWLNQCIPLVKLKHYQEALASCNKALSLNPSHPEAWSNKGVVLIELKQYTEAIAHFDKALSLNPEYAEAWSNKGAVLNELRQYQEAITHFDKTLQLRPDHAQAWSNKGVSLNELKRYEEAIIHYEKASSLKSDISWIYGDLLHAKMKIADWRDFDNSLNTLLSKAGPEQKIAAPFAVLGLNDAPMFHKQCAEIFTREKHPLNLSLESIPKHPKRAKIRIGYFSADFKNHPVSILMAELFELHDRDHFEIFGFSYCPEDGSPLRLRISQAFNQFIDVRKMTDQQVAELVRGLEIDIAVDLGGFTADSRPDIFAYRAAPIQVSYIGFLGTLGAPYMDYLLADSVLIPKESQRFYSEKIAYLPSYQVNDRQRTISDKVFTRKELGLPEKGFVFCCFNSNYKIVPATFDSWMKILKSVDDSVLFLYAENESVQINLIKEAEIRGINRDRLVFCNRLEFSEYLARFKTCDLFLDTAPYNSGATASDALWAGLPVLTLMGQSFASRVAASLLTAIGLPELITTTPQEYETLAIELAHNAEKLAALKQKLESNRLSTPLFDTPQFTKDLERAYVQMYERYQADLLPENIVVH